MEKIVKLYQLIEEAFAKFPQFAYRNPPVQSSLDLDSPVQRLSRITTEIINRSQSSLFSPAQKESSESGATKMESTSTLQERIEGYLIDFQTKFIEERKKSANEREYITKELQQIESQFTLKSFKTELRTKISYYKFVEIEQDLPLGQLLSPHGPDCISELMATIKYYFWIKEIEAKLPTQTTNDQIQTKRLIWNGTNNTLADIFYQLKRITNESGEPLLDASNEALAEFLRSNFYCFKDTSISTIKEYLEKENKRPKKGINKITLTKGFPGKE